MQVRLSELWVHTNETLMRDLPMEQCIEIARHALPDLTYTKSPVMTDEEAKAFLDTGVYPQAVIDGLNNKEIPYEREYVEHGEH